jgi:pimeloyl-ACP methyl ester carboxylesterase
MTTWPTSHRELRALSGRETARVLKLDTQGELLEGHHVVLRRGRMHYLSSGAGSPVVALHGWPGYSNDWRAVIRAASTFARVLAPDFFGFGDSDPLADPALEAADEEAFATDVIDRRPFMP